MRVSLLIALFMAVMCAFSGTEGRRVIRSGHDCSSITYLPFSLQHRVCGSDGNTYVSREHVLYENCVNNKDVSVVREGWCDEETEVGEQLKGIILAFASGFLSKVKEEMENEGTVNAVVDVLPESEIEDVLRELSKYLKESEKKLQTPRPIYENGSKETHYSGDTDTEEGSARWKGDWEEGSGDDIYIDDY